MNAASTVPPGSGPDAKLVVPALEIEDGDAGRCEAARGVARRFAVTHDRVAPARREVDAVHERHGTFDVE